MPRPMVIAALAVLAGCAAQAIRSGDVVPRPVAPSVELAPQPPVDPPKSSTLEPSGYATVEQAPAPNEHAANQPRPQVTEQQADWLWRAQGLSIEQARQRMAELVAMGPEYERLAARLRADETDNYIDARIVHLPDWSYVLYFKRDPEATLARYTKNLRFKAAQGRYTSAELDSLVRPWVARFAAAGILGVYGVNPTDGVANFSLSVTDAEYRAIAARERWGSVPDAIKLYFVRAFAIPAVDPRAAPFLRAFANDTKPTMIQPEAGFSGRIILKDGCLRLEAEQGPGPLAYFHHETGIGFDGQGYLALIDRRTGKAKGRIGEMFGWAGPNTIRPAMPGLAELKARCGDGSVAHVGSPESEAASAARNGRN